MAQGRDSATPVTAAVTAVTLLICLLAADAATFTVGDDKGWSFNVSDWTKGKSFKAGDVLGGYCANLFKYNPSAHNVAVVDMASYKDCAAPAGAKVFTSGNDRITVSKGLTYFMCSTPGHCLQGQHIAVDAI